MLEERLEEEEEDEDETCKKNCLSEDSKTTGGEAELEREMEVVEEEDSEVVD